MQVSARMTKKITAAERSSRLGIKKAGMPPTRDGLSLFVEADSIGEERGNSNILSEAPKGRGGKVSDDDNTTSPDKSNDSREPSHVFKDKQIKDDSGRPKAESPQERDYGPKSDPLRDKFRHQDPQKTLRGNKMSKSNGFKPRKKLSKKHVVAAHEYSVDDVAAIDPKIAEIMRKRGVFKVDKQTFHYEYGQYLADRKAKAEERAKREAAHNYKMSDKWRKEESGGGTVEYYDNWDVEWALYKAKDYVRKGSRLGEYKSADDARRAAQGKGEGNYVVEGTCIRDGAYWGYYVVSVNQKRQATRYQKLLVMPKETGVTHENTYKKAAKEARFVDIPAEKFLADAVTAGRYVRARLSKRASRALAALHRAGQRVQDQVSVGAKQFPEMDDRKAVRQIMMTIDEQFKQLGQLLETMDPQEAEQVKMELEEIEMGAGIEPVEPEVPEEFEAGMDDVFGPADDDLELGGLGGGGGLLDEEPLDDEPVLDEPPMLDLDEGPGEGMLDDEPGPPPMDDEVDDEPGPPPAEDKEEDKKPSPPKKDDDDSGDDDTKDKDEDKDDDGDDDGGAKPGFLQEGALSVEGRQALMALKQMSPRERNRIASLLNGVSKRK